MSTPKGRRSRTIFFEATEELRYAIKARALNEKTTLKALATEAVNRFMSAAPPAAVPEGAQAKA